MKFLVTVIDLPHSMYVVQDAPHEICCKLIRIIAICLAILVYDIYYTTVLQPVKYIANILGYFIDHVYSLAAMVITPTLPAIIAI